MNANTLLADPAAVRIEKFVSLEDSVLIVIETIKPTAICPQCSVPSRSLKCRYSRRLADLPWHNVPVRIELHTRKFRCRNELCPRKVFCERFEKLAAPFARRTNRLAQVVELLAFSLGARPGAGAAADMFFPVGKDVFLRAARKAHHQSETVKVRVLGVDDFAFRRGVSYGTILVDLEQRKPIDLLPDRTAETLAKWLEAHPEIEIVSRDRSTAYAEAARQGAPHAAQVADRWHLLKNLSELVESFFIQRHVLLAQAAGQIYAAQIDKDQQVELPVPENGTVSIREKSVPARRQMLFDAVKRLRSEGKTLRGIARELQASRTTVKKYATCQTVPVQRGKPGRRSSVLPFAVYLEKRWRAGEQNGVRLWQEIKELGFKGDAEAVQRFVRAWRTIAVGTMCCPIPSRGLAPRRVAKLLLEPQRAVTVAEREYLKNFVKTARKSKLCKRSAAIFGK